MEGKSGNEDYSERGVNEKDSRRAKKREEEAKAHHTWYQRTGPNVIVRTQLGGAEMTSETTDSFDVSCDNVSHSLNKGKRWEKAEDAEQILLEQNSPGKISFVSTSLPGHPGRRLLGLAESDNNGALIANKGGIKKYLEMENGEVSVRKPKSNRANIASLQSNSGSECRQKQNVNRNVKREEEGTTSDPSVEELHTRYSTLELAKRDPKSVERSWRSCQNQRSSKQGWTRKHVNDHMLDGNSEDQDALEDELDAYYEEQLDSEDPLMLPGIRQVKDEKQPEHAVKIAKKKEDEFSPEEALMMRKKQETIQEISKEERNLFVQLRPPLIYGQHTETLYANAKKHFNKGGPCLPVFPRTIVVHKEESVQILGTKIKCTFIAASNIPGEVILYAAPGLCCADIAKEPPVGGWQSHAREEIEMLTVSDSEVTVPAASLTQCPLCKATEQIEEVVDTVVVEPPRLFSFSCGYLACHSCWLAHAKTNAIEINTVITCVNPVCRHVPSVSEASALFSDSTIGILRARWWNSLCEQDGSVPCYACHRMLIPREPAYRAAALCSCGARTCFKCGHREHLPLSCAFYEAWADRWSAKRFKNVIWARLWSNNYYGCSPTHHLLSREKSLLKNCWRCGAEETDTWKNWCQKCGPNLPVRFGQHPPGPSIGMGDVHEARYRMMWNKADYKILTLDLPREVAVEMGKIVQDGVHLYEMIKITRVLGEERALKKQTDRTAQYTLEKLENGLDSVLFATIEHGGDLQKKSEELKRKIEEIRREYSRYM